MGRPRSPICGVGLNDISDPVYEIVNGKRKQTASYACWRAMIERCYSEAAHQRFPKYKGCTVCDEWLLFSNFKIWYDKQDTKGKQLDKDILVPGNTVYSPETCVFVSSKLNSFILECDAARGDLPLGVTFHSNGKYQAYCRSPKGDQPYIGLYDTVEAAHDAWKIKKREYAEWYAEQQTDMRIATALRNRYKDL